MTALEEAIKKAGSMRELSLAVRDKTGKYLSVQNIRYWLKDSNTGVPPSEWWVAISKASKMPLKRFLDDLK
jgi:hypothetical protein